MKLVGSVLVDQVGNGACAVSIFSRVGILDNDDFLDGLVVARLQALALNACVVVVLAFNEEVVGAGTAAAYVKANAVGKSALCSGIDAGKGKREFVRIKAGNRKRADFKF